MSQTCQRISILSNYSITLFQIMNKRFSSIYLNNLIISKCLNTAVILVVLLVGHKQLRTIQYCDVPNTISRHVSKKDSNLSIFNLLKKKLEDEQCIFYIMLTDGNLGEKYFPGHVFILEKTKNHCYIYQSYIAQYTLEDYMKKYRCGRSRIKKDTFLNGLRNIISPGSVWNEDTIKFWNMFTKVDSTEFIGCKTDNIYLCFKKFKNDEVKKNIDRFLKRSLKDIDKNIKSDNLNEYHVSYEDSLSAKPKSIYELRKDVLEMQIKIK